MKLSYKIRLIFLCLGLVQSINAQEKVKRTELTGHFIIKDNWVLSQRAADSINMRDTQFHSEIVKANIKPVPPAPPMAVAFDYKYSRHLIIKKEEFIYYIIPQEFNNDSIVSRGISTIYKIDRINNKMSLFYPDRFEIYNDENIFGYMDDNRFKLIEENKNQKRRICNYDCYQVIVKDMNTNRPVEMYVTEEIVLEYHPVFNVKKYLAKYYPLYIKFYDPIFPMDNYREYTFYMMK